MGLVTNIAGAMLCFAAGKFGISSMFAMGLSFFAFYSFRRKEQTKEQVKEFLSMHHVGGWSEEEGADWFNHSLNKIWTKYKKDLDKSAAERIQNILNTLFGPKSIVQIKVERVDVGPMPPRLIDFHFCPTARKEVLLETVLDYTGRIRLEIKIMCIPGGHLPIPASATIRRLQARVRIKVLQDERFGWENPVWISFRERPLLEFSLEPIAGFDIMDFPGLRHYLHEKIQENLDYTFVWPNRYHVYGNADHEYAPPEAKVFHGKVFLRVLRAERLKNADSGKGDVSDPYCRATLCEKSFRTKTIENDLFPVWWTDFAKPDGLKYPEEQVLKDKFLKERPEVLEAIAKAGGWKDVWWCWDVNSEKQDTKLVLEVFDEDKLSKDDSIGATDLNILELRVDSVQQKEVRLMGVANGVLFLEYWLVPKDGLTEKKEGFKEACPTWDQDTVRQLVAKDISPPRRKVLEEGMLMLKLVSASGLVNRETAAELAVSDPFVLIRLGTRKVKSNVIADTLDPKWNEVFDLELKGNTMVILEIKHFAKKRKADERFSMGRVKVDLTQYDPDVLYDQTFPVKGKGASGDLRLLLQISNKARLEAGEVKRPEALTEGSKLSLEDALKLVDNRSNRPAESVSEAEALLDAAPALAQSLGAAASGSKAETDPGLKAAAAAVVGNRGLPAANLPPQPEYAKVIVKVIRCENLKNVERFGKSDPFVKLLFDGVKRKSAVKWDNLNPEYNETFEWIIDEPDRVQLTGLPELDIRVCDKERIGKSRPLGNYHLDLQTVKEVNKEVPLELELEGGEGGKIFLAVTLVTADGPSGASDE